MMMETNQSEAYNLRYERSIAGLVKEGVPVAFIQCAH